MNGTKAATGALSGAAIGSAGGIPGATIGAGIGGLMGLFGGDDQTKYQASGAGLINGATADQANQSYGNTQTGLAQQQAFVNALQAQNGVQNQSNVFNQLQGVANGTGPNPAMAMLNNATGQNAANQQAMMASQRGAGANPALLARQAAMQGGALQQQAAGQGAAMQANQSLNAMGQMGGIAGQQVSNLGNANNAYTNSALNQQGNVYGMINNQNQNQMDIQRINSGIAVGNTTNAMNTTGGMLNGLGAAAGAFAGKQTQPGVADAATPSQPSGANNFGGLGVNKTFQDVSHYKGGEIQKLAAGGGVKEPHPIVKSLLNSQKGKKVPAMLSPGEKYLSPKEAQEVASKKVSLKESGQKVPGKAKVKGNSFKNDTVHASLEEGGFVIPKSIMESKNPEKHATLFLRAHMTKQQALKGK